MKMDGYMLNNEIEFAKWLKHTDNGTTHYNPFTQEKTESIGFSPYDCFLDNIHTIEELYDMWIITTKQNYFTNISDVLPVKGEDIIGLDDNGNKYYCFRCGCPDKNCKEFRDSITGGGLYVNIVKWKYEQTNKGT